MTNGSAEAQTSDDALSTPLETARIGPLNDEGRRLYWADFKLRMNDKLTPLRTFLSA
jgi:hypothetical protein